MTNDGTQYTRYVHLLTEIIKSAPVSVEESTARVEVERGAIYPRCLLSPKKQLPVETLLELPPDTGMPLAVVDRQGHRRPAYEGLLLYAVLGAIQVTGQPLTPESHERLITWCGSLRLRLDRRERFTSGIPAALGSEVTAIAWSTVALLRASQVVAAEGDIVAREVLESFVSNQQPTGALLKTTGSDNPETWWYHELVLLHALGSYATMTRSQNAISAIMRATNFHLHETQPDHATAQPWAVFPFVLNPETHILAEAIIHTAMTTQPGGIDGISLILLGDALHCLRTFL